MPDQSTANDQKPKRQRLTVEQRLARLDAQRQRLVAQAAKSNRRLETRRKIIVGAAILNAMSNDNDLANRVHDLLQREVTRPIDREAIAPWLSEASTSR